MLHLHLDAPDSGLAEQQPIPLLVRSHDFLCENSSRFQIVLLCELLELRSRLGRSHIKLPVRV